MLVSQAANAYQTKKGKLRSFEVLRQLRRLLRRLEAVSLVAEPDIEGNLTLAQVTDLFQKRRVEAAIKLAGGNMTPTRGRGRGPCPT